jgi:hypothetical protein
MRFAADQRPSATIASHATAGSATNAATVRAVSGVSAHGHTPTALFGNKNSQAATAHMPTPAASIAARSHAGYGRSPGSVVRGSCRRFTSHTAGTAIGVIR